jgi:hypothetical protein
MPATQKDAMPEAYCCEPLRIPASDYVTCDAVAERRESPWMLLGVWLGVFAGAALMWVAAGWLVIWIRSLVRAI